MATQVSAFRWVPPFVQGYVKDLRVRWALEEAGLPYEVTLVDGEIRKTSDYRSWQPFGQVPAYRDDDVMLFESGAILLHIAEKSATLAPVEPAAKARTTAWVFAALNSIEPHSQNFIQFDDGGAADPWSEKHRTQLEEKLTQRLAALSAWLSTKEYLEGRFTVGDLAMTTVLRELVDSGVLARFPLLDALRRRCESRPAFQRALESQLKVFRENAPAR